MKAFFFLLASCLLCTVLSASYRAKDKANQYGGLRQHQSSRIMADEDLSTDGMQKNADPEAPTDNLLTAGMVFDRITISVGEPSQPNVPFPADVAPSTPNTWKLVGKLDMSDPFQQCPASLIKASSPRATCGQRTGASCNGFAVPTSGVSYNTVCGRFRAYQVGTPDAFGQIAGQNTIEGPYVDGISITYGAPERRQHIFTYAAGVLESVSAPYPNTCPCIGGTLPPAFVGNDYYCESGNPGPTISGVEFYHADPLWDGQQCPGQEIVCCNRPSLAWFCKTFSTPISEDLEVRLCTDEVSENIALESFELYIK